MTSVGPLPALVGCRIDDQRLALVASRSLDSGERAMYERIPSPDESTRYSIGRFLEKLLGRQARWTNISHTGRFVLGGASRKGPIGVDVALPPRRPAALARRYFDVDELDWLFGLPREEVAMACARLWAVKEACFKAGLQSAIAPKAPVGPILRSTGEVDGLTWQVQESQGYAFARASREPIEGPLTFLCAEDLRDVV